MRDLVKQGAQQPATGCQHGDDGDDTADYRDHAAAELEVVASRRERGGERQEGHERRSWKSSMLKASRPWVRFSSDRSVNCCRRMAVELMAMAPPTTIATSQESPSSLPMMANTAAVAPTCAEPRPKTSRRIANHPRQREFQAQSEEQEGDAELRKLPCRAGIRHDVQGTGSEDDTNDEVGECGREADTTRQRHKEDGACEEYEDLGKRR